ncbi:uncharacterized protein LOC143151505 isoform X2 [Ptiloglossa arizonensis]|uniref:uncharacterized protein LOC143151505 isoform X2 n=1 Tax=Ptiloglossa arizonensis TaxID=3350558 RepID=UPI003F9EE732
MHHLEVVIMLLALVHIGLHIASSSGYTGMVQLLLKHGTDPNQPDHLGYTHYILQLCNVKCQCLSFL